MSNRWQKSILPFSLFIILTLWGWQYFIHSSEFWIISSAKHLFDPNWSRTIELKPLFYVFLYPFHIIPMTDWQHISLVKFIFSALGALQVILFYLIVKRSHSLQQNFGSTNWISKYLPEIVTILLITSQYYLTQFFKIRTDQLSVLLYLACIYLNLETSKKSVVANILICLILSFLSAKSIFFLFLVILNNRKTISKYLKNSTRSHFLIISLTLISLLIWLVNFNWPSVEYWIDSLHNYQINSFGMLIWIRSEFLLISTLFVATIYFFIKKRPVHFYYEFILSIIFLLIVSQKYPHFIASLIPVFFLFAYSVLENLLQTNFKKITVAIVIGVLINHLAIYHESPFRSNWEQMRFIQSVGRFIEDNHLTYIDGFAMFPRQKSVNCLVSPDDPISEKGCSDLLQKRSADLIILTPRLLPIAKDDNTIISNGFHAIGANLFIKNEMQVSSTLMYKEPPALLVFGFEF